MNYIIGKRSYLSINLQKQLKNSKIFSINEILKNKCEFVKSRKINIIYNHSYPLIKLNCTDDYGLLIKKNIIQLNYFLNYLENKKIKINIFLFSSSSAVYGLQKQIKNFDLKDNNKSLYGALKYLSEINLITQKKKFNYKLIIARVFNIYGPNEKISLISKIINLKNNKKKIHLFSKKIIYRDFIYIDDVCKIYKFLLSKGISGIYDVGTGKSTNIKKLILRYFYKDDIIENSNKFIEQKISKANVGYLKNNLNKSKFKNLNKYLSSSLED